MMITDTSTKNPVIEIATAFEFEGTLRFRVKTGCASVFGREVKAKSRWLSIVSDPKKDLIYPIVKKGKDKLVVEIAENLNSNASSDETVISSELLGLRNFREIDQRDNQLNRFVKDDTWEKSVRDKSTDIFFIIGP